METQAEKVTEKRITHEYLVDEIIVSQNKIRQNNEEIDRIDRRIANGR